MITYKGRQLSLEELDEQIEWRQNVFPYLPMSFVNEIFSELRQLKEIKRKFLLDSK